MTLLSDIGVSAPRASRNKLNQSDFVGWTLKWAKMGSACRGFVSLGKPTQIQSSDTALMAGDSTAGFFFLRLSCLGASATSSSSPRVH